MIKRQNLKHRHITSFQLILLGFLSVILLGSNLLMLPAAIRDGKGALFSDTRFTAASADGHGYLRQGQMQRQTHQNTRRKELRLVKGEER